LIDNQVKVVLEKPYSPWSLWFVGDAHFGCAAFDKDAFLRTVRVIRDEKDARWLGMGDLGNYIDFRDARFNPETADPRDKVKELFRLANKHTDEIFQALAPIADKCLGVHQGNHEWAFEERHYYNGAKVLADKLGVKYLGYEALTRIYVHSEGSDHQEYTIAIYSHHGFGSGRKAGSHMNNLTDLAAECEADIYCMGHNHQLQARKKPRYRISGRGNIVQQNLVFVNSGTYQRSHVVGIDGYEVRKNLPLTAIGSARVIVKMVRGMIGRGRFRVLDYEIVI
jgi:UDP-2,3-diacylglucosamine pyrophosphatase LpxH